MPATRPHARHTPRARPPRVLLALLPAPFTSHPARAQVPDSVQAAQPDTVRQPTADSLRRPQAPTGTRPEAQPLDPLPFVRDARAQVPNPTRPVVQFARDVPEALDAVPGAFLYDLGATGWPDGWSLRGFSPQRTTLWLDGLPFDDPLTGRPRFDLLPIAFLQGPSLGADPLGGPSAVYARFHTYDVERPRTELRFRRNSGGLQSIGVAHAQQRRVALGGRDGLLQVVGGYFGRGVDNEYPNSDIRKERRLYGRIHYRRARWSVLVTDLHSRRRIGAHSGVLPQGGFFNTVFNRAIARVEDPNARRKTIRNHLALTVRAPLVPGLNAPLLLAGYWTKQAFSYRNSPDTLAADTDRLGGRVRQALSWGRHHLHLEAGAFADRLTPNEALGATATRSHGYATVRDSVALGASALTVGGGWHVGDGPSYPSAQVRWDAGRRPGDRPSVGGRNWHVFAEGRLSGERRSWAERRGFGGTITPLATSRTSRIAEGRLGLQWQWRSLDVGLEAFGHTIRDPVDLFSTGRRDTLSVRVLGDPVGRVGGTLQPRLAARRAGRPVCYRASHSAAGAQRRRVGPAPSPGRHPARRVGPRAPRGALRDL